MSQLWLRNQRSIEGKKWVNQRKSGKKVGSSRSVLNQKKPPATCQFFVTCSFVAVAAVISKSPTIPETVISPNKQKQHKTNTTWLCQNFECELLIDSALVMLFILHFFFPSLMNIIYQLKSRTCLTVLAPLLQARQRGTQQRTWLK